ncbi:MAG: CAP domain-containing protein [Cyanobacteria bacterium J06638_22]
MAFNPTPAEQEMLELLNRMRMNPSAELNLLVNNLDPISSSDPDVNSAIRFFEVDGNVLASQWSQLTPVPPLAWNESLYNASRRHSRDMINADEQTHQLPGGPSLGERVRQAGYNNYSRVAENIFAFSDSVFHGHAGLAIDWGFGPDGIQNPPGHRQNMMSGAVREVGIGIIPENNPSTSVGPLVITQKFGNRFNFGNSWLLGVVFDDLDNDNTYDAGEGLGDVNIRIVGAGETFVTNTLSAGGYQLQLPAGQYNLTFSGDTLDTTISRTIAIGSDNVKVDVIAEQSDNPTNPGGENPTNPGGENPTTPGTGFQATPGDDMFSGTPGRDVVNGLAGNDVLRGNAGNDRLMGGTGNDRLFGGSGRDVLIGGTDNDVLSGGGTGDLLRGLGGNDRILGGTGDDRMFGGSGNDRLIGGAGNDRLLGGGGNDTFNGGLGNRNIVRMGPGNDTVQLSGAGGFTRVLDLRESDSIQLLGSLSSDDLTLRQQGQNVLAFANGDRLAFFKGVNVAFVQEQIA